MKPTADHIRSLIGEGHLQEGLQAALLFLRENNSRLYNECLQHQGRLNECERNLRLGVMPMEEAERTRAMVRYSLVEVVAKEIELGFAPQNTMPAPAAPVPKTEVFSINFNTQNAAATEAPAATASSGELEQAKAVLGELLSLLSRFDQGMAARQVTALLHGSLVPDGTMPPPFRQNNFNVAHQNVRAFKIPVEITQWKSTNRRAIGPLGNRDEGEEFVFTLAKHDERGGMPGMVRLFFSKNGGGPKITAISL